MEGDAPGGRAPIDQPESAAQAAEQTREENVGSLTHGFLFSDLRDYTRFVESKGAASAADLLLRYRAIVRRAVARFEGSEIRTEGDSFYVVFPRVSAAVTCGLAIVEDAEAESSATPDVPIRVGIGIHAGETVETADGYVGGAVNIAARVCAKAAAGEVLVTDTVRALTQTVLPVRFESRGRRALKGVAEPVAIYRVLPPSSRVIATRRRSRRTAVGAGLGAIALIGLAALAFVATRPPTGLPPGPWKVAFDGPLTGDPDPQHLSANAVALAVEEVNARGGIGGAPLQLESRSDWDAEKSTQDPDIGDGNAAAFVADPRVIAVIGPRSSMVARKFIPRTNAAGLLQCSPANTQPGLTKPRFGGLDLRSAAPTRINYVRLAPADDIEGVAAAALAFNDLQARIALVIDDTQDFGRESADAFVASFGARGGKTIRRSLNPSPSASDLSSALAPLSATTDHPTVVYFGGITSDGAPDLRKAMVAKGFGRLPFVSTDGLLDGPGSLADTYVRQAGAAGAGSYALLPAIGPVKADFVQRFRSRYGVDPDDYAGSSYACAQIVIDTLDAIAQKSPSAAGLREATRSYAVDPSHRYDTVLGTVGFDANGDNVQQFVTVYRDEPAAGGSGDWVVQKQQDFGPAP